MSQAHPDPNRVAPAAANCSLNLSNEPRSRLMAAASSPVGCPPPFGFIQFQNAEWFQCPPPLLRTAGGSFETAARISSIDLFAHSFPSRALLRFVTYALWC